MKFDPTTIRLLGRLTDQMDVIRKNPHRYEVAEEDLSALRTAGARLEELLKKVAILKAG